MARMLPTAAMQLINASGARLVYGALDHINQNQAFDENELTQKNRGVSNKGHLVVPQLRSDPCCDRGGTLRLKCFQNNGAP